MSDCRVSSSIRSVLSGAFSARHTATLMATVVTPRPPLVENTESTRPVFRELGAGPLRTRVTFSSAAVRSARSTGWGRNSKAPARITLMTISAETSLPMARMAASGSASENFRMASTDASPSRPATAAGTSMSTRSGRRFGVSRSACRTSANSPTTTAPGMPPRLLRREDRDSASESTTTMRRTFAMSSWGSLWDREGALAERTVHDFTDARDSRQKGEFGLFLGPELEHPGGLRSRGRAHRLGLHELDGHEEQELGLVVLEARAAEESAQDGNVPQKRDFGHRLTHFVVDEPGDREGLPVLEADIGRGLVLPDHRDAEAGGDEALAEIEARHLGPELEV